MDRLPPPSDEFESLRRLLTLKRHEKPPPGFFSDFSDRVLSRIAVEEELRTRSWSTRLADWLQPGRLFAPANALAACGLIFVGAGLYLVLSGPKSHPNTSVVVTQPGPAETRAAGFSVPPPAPPLEQYIVIRLAPTVQPDAETNDIPKDLFTLPRLRSVQGTPAFSPKMVLDHRP